MWVFDQKGFISVVAYDPAKDRNKSSKFPEIAKQAGTHLLVRARIKEDLDMLKAVVPSLHVETDKSADYSFRCVITRKQYKKFLAKSVDEIDYWSHFKEAARDASPKAEGRYSAMMSVWTAMSKLQPYEPYGYSGYGSTGFGKGYSYSGGKATPKPSPAKKSPSGHENMETFMEAYLAGDEATFRNGTGPRHGFEVGNRVLGYFGEGEVTAVEVRKTQADSVTVKPYKGKATTVYLSNFLVPSGLPEVVEGEVMEDDVPLEDLDLDWVYDELKKNPDAKQFDPDLLQFLDEEAFEFLTQAQEEQGDDESLTQEFLTDLYDDVLWLSATDEEKIQMSSDGAVPEKYEAEVIALFSNK